jgi:hypothetical protein
MKYDREEAYLHEKLTGGLHPAGVDLWPAVAEHLPDAPPARHPRWKLAICLAAPLLIAAGVLAGTAEFTNLRENPRPSFAPEPSPAASAVAAVEVEAASEEDAVSVDAEEPQAARLRTMEAASTELTSFFIIVFPPRNKATAHNGFAQPRAASLTKL